MQKYELLLILPGTLNDQETEARSQEIVNLVKEFAENVELQTMGKNRLAYPIKQIRYGYYYTITFDAAVEKLQIIQQKLGLLRDVLRAVISHFKTGITAQQKIAYSTDNAGVTTMSERAPEMPAMAPVVAQPVMEKPAAEPTSNVARAIDKLDLDQINKKLDDLMSGDVIPGV